MTQKKLNIIILTTFSVLAGILLVFAVMDQTNQTKKDQTKQNISNPNEDALQGTQPPKPSAEVKTTNYRSNLYFIESSPTVDWEGVRPDFNPAP